MKKNNRKNARKNKIQFFINDDVVVAKIFDFHRECKDIFYNIYPNDDWYYDAFFTKILKEYPNAYYAVAKCCKNDKMDIDFGKNLAKKRLLHKINNAKARIFYKYYKTMTEKLEQLNNLSKNFEEKSEKTMEEILSMINDN